MDHFFPRHEPHMPRPGGFLAGLRIFEKLLDWIIRLILLTDQEQKDAGLYLGDHRYR
jgi:hypothetical protein